MIPKWIRLGVILTSLFNLVCCIFHTINGCWIYATFDFQTFLVFGLLFLYDKKVEIVLRNYRDERKNGTKNH